MLASTGVLKGLKCWHSLVSLPDFEVYSSNMWEDSPPCIEGRRNLLACWTNRPQIQHSLHLRSLPASLLTFLGSHQRRLHMVITWLHGIWQPIINLNRLPSTQNTVMCSGEACMPGKLYQLLHTCSKAVITKNGH